MEPVDDHLLRRAGGTALLGIAHEDRRVVVRPGVAGLPIRLEWIDVVPVGLEQRLVTHLRRIVDDLHSLEMTRPSLNHLHVRGTLGATTHETDRDGRDAVHLEGMLHGPKAPAGECRRVQRRCQAQCQQECDVHGRNVPTSLAGWKCSRVTLELSHPSHIAPRCCATVR